MLFRVAELLGKTVRELESILEVGELYEWAEFLAYKAELEEKALDKGKAKTKTRPRR